MKLLVKVVSIRRLGIIVSLPNQLLGHIPITRVSAKISAMLESDEANGQHGSRSDDEMSQLAPELSDVFQLGQFLPAIVIAVHSQTSKRQNRVRDELWITSQRVELSTIPSLVNGSVSPENVKDGLVSIQCFNHILRLYP
jgi:rRNA biogenesis protein RRP5